MRTQQRLDNFLKWLQAEQYPHPPHPPIPFITISRQPGAGGSALARLLVSRLNAVEIGDIPWVVWDRELVQKAASELRVPQALIDDLEERRPASWLNDLFAGLSARENPEARDNIEIYRRLAGIIRAIARAGRAVLVGRGSVFVTQDLPGGIHVRLVAPLNYRVNHFARQRSMSQEQALEQVQRIQRERETFYHRFFPDTPLVPEQFTITLNTAAISEAKQVQAILTLLPTPASRAAEGENVAEGTVAS